MTPRGNIRDIPASIRQRLLNLSREQGIRFNSVLQRYAAERFLYRLSVSAEVDRFTLKGAALLRVWTGQEMRPTHDVDFLAAGLEDHAAIRAALEAVCRTPCLEDGVVFDPELMRIASIRDEQPHGGVRARLHGRLGQARLAVQVDIGFGDVITPGPEQQDYPTLLDLPAPRLWTYPRETVVAEKLEALVSRDETNSRVKDLWDIACLARRFAFDGETLRTAIAETFPSPRDLVHRREAGGAAPRLLRRCCARAALAGAATTDHHRCRRSGPARGCGRRAATLPGAGLRQPDRGPSVHGGLAPRRAVAAGAASWDRRRRR